MDIIILEYGKSVLPESMVFVNGSKEAVRDIVFRVILVKEGDRNILLDAGCETMPGFDMRDFIGPVKALENIGISPDEIDDVVITHSHHDHIESVRYFKNAVIHINKDEYESGKGYIPEGFKLDVFSEECNITENIRVLKIGGHSKGSCIVEIKKDGETYIYAGDECYLRECLDKKIPTGTSCCIEKSIEFIEKYSDDKKYNVLLAHDF